MNHTKNIQVITYLIKFTIALMPLLILSKYKARITTPAIIKGKKAYDHELDGATSIRCSNIVWAIFFARAYSE